MTMQPLSPAIEVPFGTSVAIVTTIDAHGDVTLEIVRGSWSLRAHVVLAVRAASPSARNLAERGELVINLPDATMHETVRLLASSDSSASAASTLPRNVSEQVAPPRLADCPIQMEALVTTTLAPDSAGFIVVVAHVVVLHAHGDIVDAETQSVDAARWSPLLYSLGEYRGVGAELGRMMRRVRS
jgi:flavin reductase (DIM6/NTAB) family NADH-FMN oxidoreductase RutF